MVVSRAPRVESGFGLVEMMVTLAIAGVLLSVAVPAMQGMWAGMAAAGQAEELAGAFRFARSEALRRGVNVSVCASAEPDAADPGCSGANDWSAGWVVFQDVNGDGTLNNAERVLRVHSVLGKVAAIEGGAGVNAARFGANGIALAGAGRLLVRPKQPSGSDSYTSNHRTLCLNAQGRVGVEKGDVAC